jgi:hypothetical protein
MSISILSRRLERLETRALLSDHPLEFVIRSVSPTGEVVSTRYGRRPKGMVAELVYTRSRRNPSNERQGPGGAGEAEGS